MELAKEESAVNMAQKSNEKLAVTKDVPTMFRTAESALGMAQKSKFAVTKDAPTMCGKVESVGSTGQKPELAVTKGNMHEVWGKH